ncbi:ACT domain-containing protein [candidate division KSB1 bacterium]|nr:ACT domain-containing protein [candidate division KSB1 bacterium]RQW02143.1 MAG: ACT domain-containing protein [candidate division KSB1 bacterium]
MQVRQISVFMENRAGRLQEITSILAKANINLRALSLADTSDFGILRLIVDRPDDAVKILRTEGFTIRENTVIACAIADHPGGLNSILNVLTKEGISIEYMYGFLGKHKDEAVMIIRVENTETAIETLLEGGFTLLKGEHIYSM